MHLAGALPTGIGNLTSEVASWLLIFRSSSWVLIAAYECETVHGNTMVRRSVSDDAFLFRSRFARLLDGIAKKIHKPDGSKFTQ